MSPSENALRSLSGMVTGQPVDSSISADLWPLITTQAIEHGLAPLLLYRIREIAFDPPEADLARLRRSASQTAARYTLLEKSQAALEKVLHESNIHTLWLKGMALAQTLYPDPSLRPMNDLDVLVQPSQRSHALKIVQAQGYQYSRSPKFLFSAGDEHFKNYTHHDYLVGGPSQAIVLELHHRLLGTDDALLSLKDMEWFWENTESAHTPLIGFKTLSSTACLIYLCAHAELQHHDFRLLRYLDLHLLVTCASLDWQVILERAVALRWTFAIERALQTCVNLFGTPIPDGILAQLRAQRPADEDTLFAIASRQKGSRWVSVRRVFGRLSLVDLLRLIIRILFPPPIYLRTRYALAEDQAVWPYYLYRWLDQGREVYYGTLNEWRLRQQDRLHHQK
jgi:hypothetical protein